MFNSIISHDFDIIPTNVSNFTQIQLKCAVFIKLCYAINIWPYNPRAIDGPINPFRVMMNVLINSSLWAIA